MKSLISVIFALLVALSVVYTSNAQNYWQPTTMDSARVTISAIASDSSNNIYIGNWDGGSMSTDNGQSWTNLNMPSYASNFMFRNGAIYAACGSGTYKTTNQGSSWSLIHSEPNARCIVNRNNTIYLGTDGAFYKSTNDGNSWTVLSFGIQNLIFQSNGTLFALRQNRYVIRTTNEGITWDTVLAVSSTNTSPIATVICNAPDGSILVGDNGGNGYHSTNNGATWSFIFQNNPAFFVTNFLVDAFGFYYYSTVGSNSEVYRSSNNGTDWENLSAGLPNSQGHYPYMTLCPNGYLFVSMGQRGVYRSTLTTNTPSLSLINTPVQLAIGAIDTIQWLSYGISGNVNIELNRGYPSGSWESLFNNTPNDGSQVWTVTAPYTANARMRITSVDYPTISDTSDVNFVIGIVPATPGNLVVTTQGEDAILSWARVDTSISGFPITVQRYLIYYRNNNATPWYYLWATFGADSTSFTHVSVARFSPAMFYQVTAWIGDASSDRIIRGIPVGTRKEEVERLLGSRE